MGFGGAAGCGGPDPSRRRVPVYAGDDPESTPDTPDSLLYPADMDFRGAPETWVFYADEACSAVAEAIRQSYARDGAGERLHMHIEPGMMHCYASAPVFRESRRDFDKQIERLREEKNV